MPSPAKSLWMELKKRIGNRVNALRKARGMNRDDLAGLIGRSVNAVGKLERGDHLPNLSTLLDLAEALDVSVPDLLGVDAPAQSDPKRESLMAQSNAVLHTLPTKELKRAVDLLKLLAKQQD